MRSVVEREWPWAVSLGLALAGWASGVWFWGTPESGFGVVDQWFPPVEAGVGSVPLMVIAGFVLEGRLSRLAAVAVLVMAVALGWGVHRLRLAHRQP